MQNLKLLDELLIGRVEPVIYAFSTNTIPNCLKVGDTCRPLSQRLQERPLNKGKSRMEEVPEGSKPK